jgi:lysozyme family protein
MDPGSDHSGGGQAQQKASRLDNIEQAAKIFATTMIPIIVALGGWMIQTTIEHDRERAAKIHQDQQSALDKDKISLEYVKIAKEILTSSEQKIPKELTTWSWKLLDGVSPIKFDKDALNRLIEREERIPPPALLSVAPRNFESLAAEYAQMFKEMKLTGGKQELDSDVMKISENKARYDAVEKSTGVPWYVVALIHKESNFNFTGNLLNEEPLTRKTVNVPAGRGPFPNWEASAIDGVMYEGIDRVKEWTVPRVLYELEKWNGFGYRNRGIFSPYVWSCTSHYTKGRFDGAFNPEGVYPRCGAAALLQALIERKLVALN